MKIEYEHIEADAGSSFKAWMYRQERFDCVFHHHPEIELVMILEGSGQRLVGDRLEDFEPLDLCLFGTDLPHFYVSDPDPSQGETLGAASIVIQFPENFAGHDFWQLEASHAVARLLERSHLGLHFGREVAERERERLDQLCQLRGLRQLTLLLNILEDLAELPARTLASPSKEHQVTTQNSERIERVLNYVLDHFAEPIRLGEVARLCALSDCAFSRLFHQVTGERFSDYLIKVRLHHACRLLRETDAQVLEIALASGYRNLSNFNRHFRRLYQMSPREHRKRLRA